MQKKNQLGGNDMGSILALGGSILLTIGIVILVVFIIPMLFRIVVPTNSVHIVQSSKKDTSIR